ncbi:BON domain-containing protein [Nesterenkonia sp. CF4.4]|uniref:BON domain-containing protein n=1 Tax=Nesterenkonia sp. CF4.4 TaxID=3373079 RepID=UPI003EE5E776
MQIASSSMTSPNLALQTAAAVELEWTPELDASRLTVWAASSVVTVSGAVGSYSELAAVGRAMRRVRGVSSAIINVVVDPAAPQGATDGDIRRVVERALTWAPAVPSAVKSQVRNRHITLTGEVDWDFQREAAQLAVEDLRGVRSLDNQITLSSRTRVETAEQRLEYAMLRNPRLDARSVTVTIVENTAILTGHVATLAEKKQAGLATWVCPEVTKIENRLAVRPDSPRLR